MNLVQIQERLKDAPVQAIMQYANGGNPMVPPYLALAELKRRESINQSAQAQQAMQQGQQLSVKEQVEQAAGLAALKQQVQAQGLQSLMAQARPAAIPENVPQPRRQPESEGVAGLPAGDFNFADGGIVAFAGPNGSYVEGDPDEAKARYQAARERLMRYGLKQQKYDPSGFESAKQELQQAEAALSQAKSQWERRATEAGLDRPIMSRSDIGLASRFAQQPTAPMAKAAADDSYAAAEAARARARQQYVGAPAKQPSVMPTSDQYQTAQFDLVGGPNAYEQAMRDVMAIRDPQERSAAVAALQRSAPAPQPSAEPPAPARGIAALPGSDEAMQMILGQMRTKPSLEEAAAERKKAEGLFGLAQPYGEERMKRLQAMEAARQPELESRGMERLMRVMSGVGARGLAGASPAYLQAIEQERAADAAFRKQMDELMGGVEEKRRAEAMSGMTEAQKQVQRQKELGLGVAEEIYKAQRRREDEVARINLEHQLRMMQPNEATILMRVIDDLRRRYPEKSEAEIYAMAQEAKAGATPEIKARALQERLLEQALKEWNDPMISPKDKNPKNLSQQDWLKEKLQIYGTAMPSGVGGGMGAQKAGMDVRSRADAILAGGR